MKSTTTNISRAATEPFFCGLVVVFPVIGSVWSYGTCGSIWALGLCFLCELESKSCTSSDFDRDRHHIILAHPP